MRSKLMPIMLSLVACSSEPTSSSDEGIHAEVEPLKGFAYDSGPVPSSSPVTIQVKASAGGKLTLDATDDAPGSGRFALDAGIQLATTIKSTLPGASYDGPLQGAPDLSIAIAGETTFDPMVVGNKATLMAMVTPADLVTLPLAQAMGIPAVTGDLTIQLKGGTVTAEFVGTCADAGRFSGLITVSGVVTLGGNLKVVVPLVGTKTFELPTMDMAIPAGAFPVNFTTPDDPMATGCTPTTGGGDPGTGSGSGSGSGSGTPTPTGLWDIVIHGATFSAAPSGSWDASGGLADPFVRVTVNGITYYTTVLTDRPGTATWDFTIGVVTTASLSGGFGLGLLDRDTSSTDRVGGVQAADSVFPNDDYIGSFSSVAELDGVMRTFSDTWGGVSWSVRYTFRAH